MLSQETVVFNCSEQYLPLIAGPSFFASAPDTPLPWINHLGCESCLGG